MRTHRSFVSVSVIATTVLSRLPARSKMAGCLVILLSLLGRATASAQEAVALPADFPDRAITFEAYDFGSGTFQSQRFIGVQTVGPNGAITSTGPVYSGPTDLFPYAMLDTARHRVFLHPGTFGTVTKSAVVSAGIATGGTYVVSGAFARANSFRKVGDGVRVAVFLNDQVDAPMFEADISSDHFVDPSDPFRGTGVAAFSFAVPLAAGDSVRFAVSSGPALRDGTFDFTALEVTLEGPASVALPADFPRAAIMFEEYDSGSGTFQSQRYSGIRTVGPNGSITSTGPVYSGQTGFFPYTMLDTIRDRVFLHPGTFDTVTKSAVVSAGIATTGTYVVAGTFARANSFRNAGDGVQVAVYINDQVTAPVFDAVISSDHFVDPNNPFGGTGVASFNLILPLAAGDLVRFAVSSGPALSDGTFDFTALQVAIGLGAPTITTPAANSFPRSRFVAVAGGGLVGQLIEVLVDDVVKASTPVDADGRWEVVIEPGSGAHQLTARYESAEVHSTPVQVTMRFASPPTRLKNTTPFLHLRKGDIVVSSANSFQTKLYGPMFTHVALYLGGDPDGTPIIAEAVPRDEAAGQSQVRALPLDMSTVYAPNTDRVAVFRPRIVLSGAQKDAVVAWARQATARNLPYWDVATQLVGPIAAASLLWTPNLSKPLRVPVFDGLMDRLRASTWSTDTFICSTLVWRAYLEGTGGTLDLLRPNLLSATPGSILVALSEAFLERLRPVFIVPETFVRSPALRQVR